MAGVGVEICLEVRNRHTVRVLIVNSEPSTDVDILNFDVLLLELVLNVVYPIAESLEVSHVQNLRPDVEMQANKLDILHLSSLSDGWLHVTHGYTELVLGESGCYLCVGMRAYIRIDAEADTGYFILLFGKFVDYFEFSNTFNVKAEYVLIEPKVYFPISLTDSGIDYLLGREACFKATLYFSSTDTIGSKTSLTDNAQDLGIGVCLDSIVDNKALMLASLIIDCLQSPAKEFCVVIVEWRCHILKLIYRKITFHIICC